MGHHIDLSGIYHGTICKENPVGMVQDFPGVAFSPGPRLSRLEESNDKSK